MQVVPAPCHTPGHKTESVTVHDRSNTLQQAPQPSKPHALLSPWYVPPAAQFPGAVTVLISQWPSLKQQAPGCGQGLGSQVVPSPAYVPETAAHCVGDSTWHDPSAKQHAPVAAVQRAMLLHVTAPATVKWPHATKSSL